MTKQELRKQIRAKQDALPAQVKRRLDASIAASIADLPEFREASAICLTVPIKGEINLMPLAMLAQKSGIPIAFPVCNVEEKSMTFRILEPNMRMVSGAYGIKTPPEKAAFLIPDENTLCILPGMTFDKNGNRLGRGQGYYDRFLASFPGKTIGCVYEKWMPDALPTEPHDLPVDTVVTERGFFRAGEFFPSETTPVLPKKQPISHTRTAKSDFSDHILKAKNSLRSVKKFFRAPAETALTSPAEQKPKEKKSSVFTSGAFPVLTLLCSVFLLLYLSRFVSDFFLQRGGEFLSVILLQVLVIFLPSVLFMRLRGEFYTEKIALRPPRLGQIFFLFSILIVMISGGLLVSILTGGISSLDGNFTLYDRYVARLNGDVWDLFPLILSYAILPAVCEELLFRGVLCAELAPHGAFPSAFLSGLFFAMLHGNFSLFLPYFTLGLLLSVSRFVTRSLPCAIILHLCYNLFCLFGQPTLSDFYLHAGSNEIFVFLLGLLCLLFSAFAAGEARKIYHIYARRGLPSPNARPIPSLQSVFSILALVKSVALSTFDAVKSPVILPILVLWILLSV